MTFKVGDKVVCVEASPNGLTVGKEYVIKDIIDDHLGSVVNDYGRYENFSTRRFTPAHCPVKTFLENEKWEIAISSEEELKAAIEWVKSHTSFYNYFTDYYPEMVAITNTDNFNNIRKNIMWLNSSSRTDVGRKKITLSFKTETKVVDFKLPAEKTKSQIELEKLQQQIVELTQQANILAEEVEKQSK